MKAKFTHHSAVIFAWMLLIYSGVGGVSSLEAQSKYQQIYKASLPGVVAVLADNTIGSGFIVHQSGIVVTNSHCIGNQGARFLKFVTGDGLAVSCDRILYNDPEMDIAVLQLESGHYTALPMGSIGITSPGEEILVIGMPSTETFTSAWAMTRGIVSNMVPFVDAPYIFQMDASVNPGNSGGPVINTDGEVVGVVVARMERSTMQERDVQNINFAINGQAVNGILQKLNIPTAGRRSGAYKSYGGSSTSAAGNVRGDIYILNTTGYTLHPQCSYDGDEWTSFTVVNDQALIFREQELEQPSINVRIRTQGSKTKQYRLQAGEKYKFGWNEAESCWDVYVK